MIIAKDDIERPTNEELDILVSMVYTSTLNYTDTIAEILNCQDYKEYERLAFKLEDNQKGFNEVVNPSAKQVNRLIKKITG